jgi:hypothetical protein
MIDISDFLKTNNKFIERFVDLTLCRDAIYDSVHRWYYSLISIDKLEAIQYLFLEDDIRSEINLHIIEQAQNYSKNPKLFKQYLQKDLIWFLKYKVNSLVKQLKEYQSEDIQYDSIDEFALDAITLKNLFSNKNNIYNKYLLYLHTNKCYTINQISDLIYRERSSLRKDLKHVVRKFRNYHGKGTS